jgi:hypothetical protein
LQILFNNKHSSIELIKQRKTSEADFFNLLMTVMKKPFTFLLIAFAGFSASSQDITSKASLNVYKPAKSSDKCVDRKFQGNGNKLLNLNGSLPRHIINTRPVRSNNLKISPKPTDQLIGNTLLFTGKLNDYISQPFLLTPESPKRTSDKY